LKARKNRKPRNRISKTRKNNNFIEQENLHTDGDSYQNKSDL